MYAIVEISGQQFKVEENQNIFVQKLNSKEGSNINFDVLLMDNDGKVSIGEPVVEGVQVTAKVIEHLKGKKVIVFKKKRRKGYKVKNGHRQHLTKLEILTIDTKKTKKKAIKSDTKKAIEKKTTTAAKKTTTVAKKTTTVAKKTTTAAKKTTTVAKKTTTASKKTTTVAKKTTTAAKKKTENKSIANKVDAKKNLPKQKAVKKDIDK